jgi:hypothetical protein
MKAPDGAKEFLFSANSITQLYSWASADPAEGAIESVKLQRRQEPQNSVQLSRERLEQRHNEASEQLEKKMRG